METGEECSISPGVLEDHQYCKVRVQFSLF